MLELLQYKFIKEVKDKSPFTQSLGLQEYINGVKFRLAQWYGIDEESVTDADVYNFLKKSQEISQK